MGALNFLTPRTSTFEYEGQEGGGRGGGVAWKGPAASSASRSTDVHIKNNIEQQVSAVISPWLFLSTSENKFHSFAALFQQRSPLCHPTSLQKLGQFAEDF